MMNLYQLTTFCTVLNEGSMTAAADKLFLTQPAVSQQIRALEEELKVELLVRGVRQIKPTLQGQLLYDYAKKIIQLSQQAEVAIQTIGTEVRGDLRVGTLNSIGLYLISPVVGLFLRHNTDLRIKLDYSRGEDLIQSMNKGELDILILPETGEEYGIEIQNVETKFLMKEEMWLVASGKDTGIPRTIKMDEYTARPTVAFSGEYPQFMKKLKSEIDKRGLTHRPVFESPNVGTLKRVIESGLGWGFVPSHCIAKQIRSGRMVRVHVDDLYYEINFTFYYRKELETQPATDVFFRALQHQART